MQLGHEGHHVVRHHLLPFGFNCLKPDGQVTCCLAAPESAGEAKRTEKLPKLVSDESYKRLDCPGAKARNPLKEGRNLRKESSAPLERPEPPAPPEPQLESLEVVAAEGLLFTSDRDPGIRRTRRGRGFLYFHPDGKRIGDGAQLARIRSRAIPPAYRDVWICLSPRGHLQATGHDARGRKQYRYHELFQWIDADGGRHRLDSNDVNEYLREASGGPFTAKDFRTWYATVVAYAAGRLVKLVGVTTIHALYALLRKRGRKT